MEEVYEHNEEAEEWPIESPNDYHEDDDSLLAKALAESMKDVEGAGAASQA